MADQTDVAIKVEKKGETEDGRTPSLDDWTNLRKVSDKLPVGAWFVILCEFCERFTYYGISGPFQNYIQFPPPPPSSSPSDRQPGAIGAGQQTATSLTLFFQFFCYITPLLGSVIADNYLGRFKTIIVFSIVYTIGLTVLVLTSIPQAIASSGVSFIGLIISMLIIGFGTGGIKSNVGPLTADQYTNTRPFVKKIERKKNETLHQGEKREDVDDDEEEVIVDPKLTIQSIFHWFYLSINIGALSPLIITVIEKYHSYWLAYLIPIFVFVPSIFILLVNRNRLIKNKPNNVKASNNNNKIEGEDNNANNNSILNFFRITGLVITFRSTNLDNFKPSNFKTLFTGSDDEKEAKAKKYNVDWSDKFVDEFKQVLKVCKVFLFYPFYWICYLQMVNNLISQAATMQVGKVPNDVMNNLNPVALMIFIPFANYVFLAMAYSAIIQHFIYTTGPCYINTRCEIDGVPVPNDIITALFLTTSGISSAIGLLIVPLSKDPYLVYMYSSLAVCAFISGSLLLWFFKKYDKEDEEDEKSSKAK
ncbi:474_t:CDS:2 [Entrophospora sp. SA101]|nr:3201_t:CDS:2 [Entrophospora sp. SA101]CAJ0758003.1 3203_t:CDS:2 [Entrophospora sp. SA101]CAJ0765291.1 474_t:CDS:2 [Entrophospora sp. SA101]CAJ0831489.1 15146_t:CDS:2 [Entrophospora sp. SA101]